MITNLKQSFFGGITGNFSLMINELPIIEVTDGKFKMWNDGSIECETGEFLYGFIRRLKPINVLETGTYKGWGAAYMAAGLKENGFGHLTTLEIESLHIQSSKILWNKLQLEQWITAERVPSFEYKPITNYQFILLDTEPNIRFAELEKYYDNLEEGGYIFIHDTPRNLCQGNFNPDHPEIKSWPFGDVPEKMKALLRDRKIMPFHFGSARGLVGYYKVHKDDYV